MGLRRLAPSLAILLTIILVQWQGVGVADGFSLKIRPIFDWPLLSNILTAIKTLEDLLKALKTKNGSFMINGTFYNDLISSCEELRTIDNDFSFFNSSTICPNITDVLMGVAATIKVATGPLMEIAAIGSTLADDVKSCTNDSGLTKDICYFGIAPPAIKDIKYLMFSVHQFMDIVKTMIQSAQADLNYCSQTFSKLPNETKEEIRKQWFEDSLEKTTTCKQRAQEFINLKRTKG